MQPGDLELIFGWLYLCMEPWSLDLIIQLQQAWSWVKAFYFPGTIKRMEAFKQGAKDGVKIMIGLMPVFALAAFFEGFITRRYNDVSVLTTKQYT